MRGGYRFGSGRKALPDHSKKKPLSIYLDDEKKALLLSLSQDLGLPVGGVIELMMDSFLENCEKE